MYSPLTLWWSYPSYLLDVVERPPHGTRLLRRPAQVRRLAGHAGLRRRHCLVLRRQRRRRARLQSCQPGFPCSNVRRGHRVMLSGTVETCCWLGSLFTASRPSNRKPCASCDLGRDTRMQQMQQTLLHMHQVWAKSYVHWQHEGWVCAEGWHTFSSASWAAAAAATARRSATSRARALSRSACWFWDSSAVEMRLAASPALQNHLYRQGHWICVTSLSIGQGSLGLLDGLSCSLSLSILCVVALTECCLAAPSSILGNKYSVATTRHVSPSGGVWTRTVLPQWQRAPPTPTPWRSTRLRAGRPPRRQSTTSRPPAPAPCVGGH